MKSNELLLDAFGRIREAVAETLEGVDDEALAVRPAGRGNTIAWLVWHLSRIEDVQVSAPAGLEEVWTSHGFEGRFDLPAGVAIARVVLGKRQVETAGEPVRRPNFLQPGRS